MGARLALGFPLACAAVAPHVLLLMTDQQRVDSLTAYRAGTRAPDGRSLTPNLDRLARDGARFTSAYSSTPTCTPARSTFWHALAKPNPPIKPDFSNKSTSSPALPAPSSPSQFTSQVSKELSPS